MHFPLPVSHISSGSIPRKSPDFSSISHRRGLPQEKWPELSGYRPLYIGQSKRGKKFAPAHCVSRGIFFRAAPHNGARRFGQCFDPGESMENVGMLDVFPIFHTARLGQKIRRSPQLPLCGVALDSQVPRKPGKPDARLNTMGHSDHASGSELQEESLLSEAKRWIYQCILK